MDLVFCDKQGKLFIVFFGNFFVSISPRERRYKTYPYEKVNKRLSKMSLVGKL